MFFVFPFAECSAKENIRVTELFQVSRERKKVQLSRLSKNISFFPWTAVFVVRVKMKISTLRLEIKRSFHFSPILPKKKLSEKKPIPLNVPSIKWLLSHVHFHSSRPLCCRADHLRDFQFFIFTHPALFWLEYLSNVYHVVNLFVPYQIRKTQPKHTHTQQQKKVSNFVGFFLISLALLFSIIFICRTGIAEYGKNAHGITTIGRKKE